MTDETAADWLAAAIAETAHIGDALFRQGVSEARRSCTFHGQIVPAVLRPHKGVEEYRQKLGLLPVDRIECAGRLGDVVKRITVE